MITVKLFLVHPYYLIAWDVVFGDWSTDDKGC
jgi:hypothetical protein